MRVLTRVLNALYPPFCLHCREKLSSNEKHLCLTCFSLLELSSYDKRCRRCFQEKKEGQIHCSFCARHLQFFTAQAAAFESCGPAISLWQQLERGKSYLAPLLAAYLAVQWERLNWPKPDRICSLPRSLEERVLKGKGTAPLLTKALTKYLLVPYCSTLYGRSLEGKVFLIISDRLCLQEPFLKELLRKGVRGLYLLALLDL